MNWYHQYRRRSPREFDPYISRHPFLFPRRDISPDLGAKMLAHQCGDLLLSHRGRLAVCKRCDDAKERCWQFEHKPTLSTCRHGGSRSQGCVQLTTAVHAVSPGMCDFISRTCKSHTPTFGASLSHHSRSLPSIYWPHSCPSWTLPLTRFLPP